MSQVANTRVVNGINTRVLHNKDYVEVAERIRILHELRKAGEVSDFEMVESQPYQFASRWVWRVSARINGKLYIGNAEVKLDASKNTPDGTNPFECAETSAFGRMLAFAGLGTIESIASYDEVMRGQPFVAVIEQPNNKVVESGKPAKQLPAPNGSQSRQNGQEGLQSKLDALYERANEKGIVDGLKGWEMAKAEAFGCVMADEKIEIGHYETLRRYIVQKARQVASAGGGR